MSAIFLRVVFDPEQKQGLLKVDFVDSGTLKAVIRSDAGRKATCANSYVRELLGTLWLPVSNWLYEAQLSLCRCVRLYTQLSRQALNTYICCFSEPKLLTLDISNVYIHTTMSTGIQFQSVDITLVLTSYNGCCSFTDCRFP